MQHEKIQFFPLGLRTDTPLVLLSSKKEDSVVEVTYKLPHQEYLRCCLGLTFERYIYSFHTCLWKFPSSRCGE